MRRTSRTQGRAETAGGLALERTDAAPGALRWPLPVGLALGLVACSPFVLTEPPLAGAGGGGGTSAAGSAAGGSAGNTALVGGAGGTLPGPEGLGGTTFMRPTAGAGGAANIGDEQPAANCDAGTCPPVDPCATPDAGGSDQDEDGRIDTCDLCPDVANQDDGADADGDGTPDACDRCGIGVALGLSPLFYFSLDDAPGSITARNLGSVPLDAAIVGPVQLGLRGISDPNGQAALFAGQQGGAFSRIAALNVPAFPSTALTASAWIRTSQTTDCTIFSYAVQPVDGEASSNEFGIILEADSLRITLNSSEFQSTVTSRTALGDGAWHFLAVSWQETTTLSEARVYVDGAPVGSLQTIAGNELTGGVSRPVTGPLSLRTGGALIIGQDQDTLNGTFSAAQALNGGIDEVALYDRVLTDAEILAIFQGTTCGERCDGQDNDADGKVDEGFLGSAPACPATSCLTIQQQGEAIGTGTYFLSASGSPADAVPTACAF